MARLVHVWPKLTAVVLLTAALAHARPAVRGTTLSVTAVRFWTLRDVTRIAIETTGDFHFLSDQVANPDRIYFDIVGARSKVGPRGLQTIPVGDPRVRQIRVAQTQLAVTRIVLDLEVAVDFTASELSNPDRLVIEIRAKGTAPQPGIQAPEAPVKPPVAAPSISGAPRLFVAPPSGPLIARQADVLPPPPTGVEEAAGQSSGFVLPPVRVPPAPRRSRARTVAAKAVPTTPAASGAGVTPQEAAERVAAETTSSAGSRTASTRKSPAGDMVPRAATKNSDGARSMTRVLGLKVGRIVIDPGHGGHDTGTTGKNGLQEKDLVLDVSRRLGKLIVERMGSEVIFTRSDDTFIPLEMRTEIANEKRADLFLSVHANSSPIRTITGVETFYLNFSTSKADLDVAARENASSQKTVYELKDLLQRIALQDKVEESREFAERVQASLFSFSSRNSAKLRNRGVKKAPFVVLIGAQMPSILAEIGFVSNPREEALMNRPEHRQKLAEALYKGLAQYAGTLSHFQLAQTSGE